MQETPPPATYVHAVVTATKPSVKRTPRLVSMIMLERTPIFVAVGRIIPPTATKPSTGQPWRALLTSLDVW